MKKCMQLKIIGKAENYLSLIKYDIKIKRRILKVEKLNLNMIT